MKKLALIAGTGALPLDVLRGAQAGGWDVSVFALGEFDRFTDPECVPISHISPREAIARVMASKPDACCLIGALTLNDDVRRAWRQAFGAEDKEGDAPAKREHSSGDHFFFGLFSGLAEKLNVQLIGAHAFVADQVVSSGTVYGEEPSEFQLENIAKGSRGIKILGQLDIGQAMVIADGRIVAVEGAEGTDGLLRRVGEMLRVGTVLPGPEGAILVKGLKPEQITEIDMPTIGAETVRLAAAAQVKVIAVEAGGTLIAEKENTLAELARLEISLYGFSGN